jgi:hypothetical protein
MTATCVELHGFKGLYVLRGGGGVIINGYVYHMHCIQHTCHQSMIFFLKNYLLHVCCGFISNDLEYTKSGFVKLNLVSNHLHIYFLKRIWIAYYCMAFVLEKWEARLYTIIPFRSPDKLVVHSSQVALPRLIAHPH